MTRENAEALVQVLTSYIWALIDRSNSQGSPISQQELKEDLIDMFSKEN